MNIVLASIGKLKEEAELRLLERSVGRIKQAGRAVVLGPVEMIELSESRLPTPQARKDDEAQRLLARVPPSGFVVTLDERGKSLSSEAFAQRLAAARDDGVRAAVFLLGGPDGHGAAARERANVVLSLSAMTLPHGLARVVLAEQLYRAVTILSGHPYHRE
jgi:23S rRNA (pseudouridine1915-N3)-methyltransferase